ncbi:alpha/beta fold hydrolase [Mycolicibacterium hippocampi]|uniref:alpha/beta fold hydrolase n=1 Tax=Mycolicibacterium hippocampi TaxID=659824 RepID=UPI003518701F
MPLARTPTGTVAYTDQGTGPAVVLLHATLHDRTDYTHVAAALAGRYRVISVDWPGHGDSPAPAVPLSTPLLADALEQFVSALDLRDAVFVGNSVGGFAACRIALRDPSRVAGLVLVNGSGFTPWTPVSRAFCALMGHPGTIGAVFRFSVPLYMAARTDADRDVVARVLARARTRVGRQTAAALWRSVPDPADDLRALADRITSPTLITWGTRDRTLRRSWGRAMHHAISGSAYVEFDTGHLPFTSDPQGWLGVVEPFLERVLDR